MGICCDLPAYIYGDNQSVLPNTTNPFSVFKKKSSYIDYYFFREGVAKDEWKTTYTLTNDNVAYLLTKHHASGEKRIKCTNMILNHIMWLPSGD